MLAEERLSLPMFLFSFHSCKSICIYGSFIPLHGGCLSCPSSISERCFKNLTTVLLAKKSSYVFAWGDM